MTEHIWHASKRTEAITYAVRDILLVANKAKEQNKDMMYLNIGDPNKYDFDVPKHLIEAMTKAMYDNKNGYGPSEGVPEALEAIRHRSEKNGVRNICDVFTSYGASESIEICITALCDSGDNIILPSPGYPLYSAINAKLNIESRFYSADEDNNWQPNIDDIANKIDARTKAIVLINPNNPTGSVYTKETLLEIIELARKNRLIVFSDEIYDQMVYDGNKHVCTASLTEDVPVITFNGLSKCYLAPGWRVGWAVISGPQNSLKEYIAAIHKMTRARLCINHPIQYAIQPALEGNQDHIGEIIKKLETRRDITYKCLNAIKGISCVKPQGAFYAFPKIEIDIADKTFVEELVLQTGVVVVHGSGFGEGADGHFRVVFLPQEQVLEEAFQKLANYTKQYLS